MTLPPHDPQWEVTPRGVADLREADGCDLLLDVRTPREVETASIDGAAVIEMQEVPKRLDELERFRGKKVVVFCHGGVRSLRVAKYLRDQGFTDAWSMQGGIHAWSMQIDPSVPKY
ncbi:MAG: rhodanese-like domain-containing protein [Planctomycetota bacterium]